LPAAPRPTRPASTCFPVICNGLPLRACRSGQPRSIRWPEAHSGPHVRSMTSTLLWPM
jgi:hypothetical protein